MKRLLAVVFGLLFVFTGCASEDRTDITRGEIVTAYESAGYAVQSFVCDGEVDVEGLTDYIVASHPSGEDVYFDFFSTETAAREYAADMASRKLPEEQIESYGKIVVTYCRAEHFVPFAELLEGK
ncbi:MAG: hypothetical protein E7461_03030 [Ruminococcaceae bacterium]|nr:hypothetical protein [Oscillospiraceae bacterium]